MRERALSAIERFVAHPKFDSLVFHDNRQWPSSESLMLWTAIWKTGEFYPAIDFRREDTAEAACGFALEALGEKV